ncbi:50S ribosomal protein L1 [Candidatus Woesearchaeota archaeon]|nr:50S ribosomal protein L1 [Candidatus Woesearchaeota archaeon]
MEKQYLKQKYEELLKTSKKRNFKQRVELIFSLKDLDLKKPENQLEFYVVLPHELGKKPKICCVADNNVLQEAKNVFDTVLTQEDLKSIDKKSAKKLVKSHKWFVASSSLMPLLARVMGKFLGSRGKMPSPKAGTIITEKTSLKDLKQKLERLVKVVVKKQLAIQAVVGSEDMNPEHVVENVAELFNNVVKQLPREEKNLKAVYLKLTMSKPLKIYPLQKKD